MRTPSAITLGSLVIALVFAVPAAAAPLPPGPVQHCGTLQSYAAVDPARIGSASAQFAIDGTTYTIALSPPSGPSYRQTIDPAAKTVGVRVCLDGTIVEAHTIENLLGDLSLRPNSAAVPGQLPSTSTEPPTVPDHSGLLMAFGLIAIALYVFTLIRQRSRKRAH